MISAKVICDSISEVGVRLTTMEIEYPRIILSELNTHRMLSKNSASSRAIPFAKMMENLKGRPVRFGGAAKGMQDNGEHDGLVEGHSFDCDNSTGTCWPALDSEEAWEEAKSEALFWSEAFYKAGYAKQVYNRLTEPFHVMKTVISATEWANFFYLRIDVAADPTLYALAVAMKEALEGSVPTTLKPGQWHLPYVGYEQGTNHYYMATDDNLTEYLSLEEAIKVSAARAAAVSFRNTDYNLEKCLQVYERLVDEGKLHGSALEHQATPVADCVEDLRIGVALNCAMMPSTWEKGISHTDRKRNLWSGNFKGWIQWRKTLGHENYTVQ